MNWAYLFLRFDGRISRKPYWIAFCSLTVASLGSLFVFYYLGQDRLSNITDLALLYPEFAVLTKRAHDRETPIWIVIAYLALSALLSVISFLGFDGPFNNPSTLYWIVVVPMWIAATYLIIDLGFRRGTRGPNGFGPDPLEMQP
jgi:uncharacterized membrane protein YhaH (DUF805 family)